MLASHIHSIDFLWWEKLRIAMSAMESLCKIVGISSNKLSKKENFILEAELFTRVCEGLKDLFKIQYKNCFHLMKCNTQMEDAVMEAKFIRCVINDILLTEDYTLSGIAYYTQAPEEVVYEVAIGLNTNPSAKFLRKIIELHRSVRPDLYRSIVKKITTEYLTVGERLNGA